MTEECCCGNTLRSGLAFRMRSSPCRCEEPGPGSRCAEVRHGIPSYVFKKQWAERTKLNLPLETQQEKSIRRNQR